MFRFKQHALFLFFLSACFSVAGFFVALSFAKSSQETTGIRISEIQTHGATARDEFIELYNPSPNDVPLTEWSIQYQPSQSARVYKKNFPADAHIPGFGFFLIAYSGANTGSTTPNMTHKTFSLSQEGGTVFLVASQDAISSSSPPDIIIDRVAWGTATAPQGEPAPAPPPGESIERKATATSTAVTLAPGGVHALSGNGYATGNNKEDFVIQNTPSPQSSYSEIEPTPLALSNDPPPEENQPEQDGFPFSYSLLLLSELYPNPPDESGEFIEIANTGTTTIDIAGVVVQDQTRSYEITPDDFPNGTLLAPGAFFLLPKGVSRIALNNTGGETVSLLSPSGETTDSTTYTGNAPEGQAWARKNGVWQWTTTPTPEKENIITTPPPKKDPPPTNTFQPPISTPSRASSQKTSPARSLSLPPRAVLISELYPNPPGPDAAEEFIELYNSTDNTLSLHGLRLADASGNTFLFSEEDAIPPRSRRAFFRPDTRIALNNTNEHVFLFASDMKLLDTASYSEKALEGKSYSRLADDTWQWTTPTPDEENEPPAQDTDTPSRPRQEPKKPAPENSELLPPPFLQIYFSELLPNPPGSDTEGEWIEIFNPNLFPVNLSGWRIIDQSESQYSFQEQRIQPRMFLVLPRSRTRIALNNTADEVSLFDANGRIVHAVAYYQAREGESYAYIPGTGWRWSSVSTPNAPNILSEENTSTPQSKPQKEKTENNSAPNPSFFPISELRDLPIKTAVTTAGYATVLPGTLGKTRFYIQELSSGIQIYSAKGAFPKLSLGQRVSVTGFLSSAQGESRIRVRSAKDITPSSSYSSTTPTALSTGDISEDYEGMLVATEGEIVRRRGSTLYLDDGSGEVRVYIKKESGIALPSPLPPQPYARTTGIVSQTRAGMRILPRFPSDISVSSSAAATTTATATPMVLGARFEPATFFVPPQPSPASILLRYTLWAIVAVVLFIVGTLGYFFWENKRKEKIFFMVPPQPVRLPRASVEQVNAWKRYQEKQKRPSDDTTPEKY